MNYTLLTPHSAAFFIFFIKVVDVASKLIGSVFLFKFFIKFTRSQNI